MFQESGIGTPVTLRVDPKGFFLYWADQNNEIDLLDIALIRDVRTGPYAKKPRVSVCVHVRVLDYELIDQRMDRCDVTPSSSLCVVEEEEDDPKWATITTDFGWGVKSSIICWLLSDILSNGSVGWPDFIYEEERPNRMEGGYGIEMSFQAYNMNHVHCAALSIQSKWIVDSTERV